MTAAATVTAVVAGAVGGPPLRATLDSLFNQTRTPAEVILLSGSDGTFESAMLPYMNRLSVIAGTRRAAVGWNEAARLASGEYLAFIDGGVTWPSDFVEDHVDYMAARPKSAAVLAASRRGNTLEAPFAGARESVQLNLHGLIAHTPKVFLPAAIVRRDALDQAGGFDASVGAGIAFDLMLRLARGGRVIAVRNVPAAIVPAPQGLEPNETVSAIESTISVLERFGTRHALEPELRTALRIRIMQLIDRLALEQARCRILEGHCAAARFHLASARHPWARARVAVVLLRLVPRLARAMYRRASALAGFR